jgi:hypothetical protein
VGDRGALDRALEITFGFGLPCEAAEHLGLAEAMTSGI